KSRERSSPVTSFGQTNAKVVVSHAMIGLLRNSSAVVRLGFAVLSLFRERDAEQEQSLHRFRGQLHGGPQRFLGAPAVVGRQERVAQRAPDVLRLRIVLDDATQQLDGFVQLA